MSLVAQYWKNSMLPHHLSPKGIGWKESQRPPELEITGVIDKYIYILNGTKWDNFYLCKAKGKCRKEFDEGTEDRVLARGC